MQNERITDTVSAPERETDWIRWRRLRREDRWLLVEAVFVLAVVCLAVKRVRFRFLLRRLSQRRQWPPQAERDLQSVARRMRWALRAAGRRMPWRCVCVEQGVAAMLMLRWRGIASTLFYGASVATDGKLSAHVWVKAGTVCVIGCENAEQFSILARFPEDEP